MQNKGRYCKNKTINKMKPIKYIKHITQKTANRQGYEIKQMYPRPSIKFIKERFGNKELFGAEIGVFSGVNAKSILKTLTIKKMYLIDPYQKFDKYKKIFPNSVKSLNYEDIYKMAGKSLVQWKNRAVFIRKISDEAHKDIHQKLDFVYIDGNHEYEYIKRDIKNYYNLLKSGGVLAGHDIENAINPYPEGNEVCKAVTEFAVKNELYLYIQAPDWWLIKP